MVRSIVEALARAVPLYDSASLVLSANYENIVQRIAIGHMDLAIVAVLDKEWHNRVGSKDEGCIVCFSSLLLILNLFQGSVDVCFFAFSREPFFRGLFFKFVVYFFWHFGSPCSSRIFEGDFHFYGKLVADTEDFSVFAGAVEQGYRF